MNAQVVTEVNYNFYCLSLAITYLVLELSNFQILNLMILLLLSSFILFISALFHDSFDSFSFTSIREGHEGFCVSMLLSFGGRVNSQNE